jgi:NAD(P) transhydrogenase subunit alpha
MIVGVPRKTLSGSRRVARGPAAVPALFKAGCAVLLERGAGEAAGYPDALYADRGARTGATRSEGFGAADILVQVLNHGANDRTGRDDLPLEAADAEDRQGYARPQDEACHSSAQPEPRLVSS